MNLRVRFISVQLSFHKLPGAAYTCRLTEPGNNAVAVALNTMPPGAILVIEVRAFQFWLVPGHAREFTRRDMLAATVRHVFNPN